MEEDNKIKAYIISVRKMEEGDKEKKNLDKIGGYPTHLPPKGTYEEDYFLMQIYNDKGIWPYKEGVLCWQFYQDDKDGGYIGNVIEVPVGAKLNTGKRIKKRRGLDEYVIEYQEVEEIDDKEALDYFEYEDKYYDFLDEDFFIRSKVGGYFWEKKWYEEAGYECVAIISDILCNGQLNLGTGQKTIIKNIKTGKLEMGGN